MAKHDRARWMRDWDDWGYVSPVPILSPEAALSHRARMEAAEAEIDRPALARQAELEVLHRATAGTT